MDLDELQQWVGNTEIRTDQVTSAPVRALTATLDREDAAAQPGDPIPLGWHWLYFLPLHRQSELDVDGHPRRGGFLPPVPLPRRMWAGSRIELVGPLRIGEVITRTSRIESVNVKQGRTGPLVFVRVRHSITNAAGVSIVEDQDIVYRELPTCHDASTPVTPAPTAYDWIREVRVSDAMLFRYSALTFNAHRIHYNRLYAREVEGYPGLVVHGPLLATLLLDLLRRQMPDAQVSRFVFRAVTPVFDVTPFQLCGRRGHDDQTFHLWAQHTDGFLAMDATATLA